MNWRLGKMKLRGKSGQTLPMMVLMIIVLIVFVGLGIDVGFAYLTRAALSKAVDAACMAAVSNLSLGKTQARAVALSTFDMNFKSSGVAGRDVADPVVNAIFNTDANNNTLMDVTATVSINTFFVRVLPNWKTMTVSASGEAIRVKVIMSLVLDRSGSMTVNGGQQKLPPAVNTFISLFDDTLDRAAMASFASDARTNGSSYFVSMRQPFMAAITNAVNAMPFGGGTFSQGGLTNGFVQIQSVPVAADDDVVKVCVFFTDGLANIVQDSLNCGGTPTIRNFGGYDSGNYVGFFNPSNGNQDCFLSNGGTPSCCTGVSTFKSAIDGTQKSFIRPNVTADAEYRAVQTANQMRANGIIVYSIGLGNNINQTFLKQIANDPSAPSYVATSYDGEAVFAPTSAQLQSVFETIAKKILLRLTR